MVAHTFFHRSSGRSQWNPPLTRESRTRVSRTNIKTSSSESFRKDRGRGSRSSFSEQRYEHENDGRCERRRRPHLHLHFRNLMLILRLHFLPHLRLPQDQWENIRTQKRPAEEKKIKRTPREPPKLAVIYRRQSLKEQKEKMLKSGVVVEDDVSKEDFSEYSNDALEKEYRRQLETERRLLRKAAMLRKELQRPKNVFDGRNPFLSPRHGDESQEYIRSEASYARKRRVRIYQVLLERVVVAAAAAAASCGRKKST